MLDGHVYVIGFEDGYVKVGASTNPKNRLLAVERQSGRVKNQEWVSPHVFDAIKLERAIHKRLALFKAHPKALEWFVCNTDRAIEIAEEMLCGWQRFSTADEDMKIETDPRYESRKITRDRINELGILLAKYKTHFDPA